MPEVIGDLEALLAEVHRRTEQRAFGLEQEAKQRVLELLEQADAEAKEAAEVLARQAQGRETELRRQLLAQSELEVKRRLIEAREALLEGVWREAETRLRQLPEDPSYPETLRRLTLAATQELGQKHLLLAADPRGHELLTPQRLAAWSKEADACLERASQAMDSWGGLQLHCGRRRYDATFASRLELARQVLREEVFALLTDGES